MINEMKIYLDRLGRAFKPINQIKSKKMCLITRSQAYTLYHRALMRLPKDCPLSTVFNRVETVLQEVRLSNTHFTIIMEYLFHPKFLDISLNNVL